jgi:hypothetical protein
MRPTSYFEATESYITLFPIGSRIEDPERTVKGFL